MVDSSMDNTQGSSTTGEEGIQMKGNTKKKNRIEGAKEQKSHNIHAKRRVTNLVEAETGTLIHNEAPPYTVREGISEKEVVVVHSLERK